MSTILLEMEGTAEEVQKRLNEFAGQHLTVTVRTQEQSNLVSPASSPRKLTITEKMMERFSNVPPEERAKVPADLTDNLDHYIYGLPKK